MDPNVNAQTNTSSNRGHHQRGQQEPPIQPASTSSSDPGPNYASVLARNRNFGNRGGRRSGYHHGRNANRSGSHRGNGMDATLEGGNRSRSMFTATTSSQNGHGDGGSGNFHAPRISRRQVVRHTYAPPQENSQDSINPTPQNRNRPQDPLYRGQFFQPNSRTVSSFMSQRLAWNMNGETVNENSIGGTVNPRGFMSLRLSPYVRIDMTANRAIRIQNDELKIIMAVSGTGTSCALVHPAGSVYQYDSRVEVVVPDRIHDDTKIAKLWHKGISFTSDNSALIYLVDSAGVRTTNDIFSDLAGDITYPVFTEESLMGPEYIQRCMEYLRSSNMWMGDDGSENWDFNGIKICALTNGSIRVARGNTKYTFRTTPTGGGAYITTPFIHCSATGTINGAPDNYNLFIKRGERRLHYDGQSFVVRNGGQSAGFDFRNKIKVF